MSQQWEDARDSDAVEKLKQKYLARRRQLLPSEDIASGTRDDAVQRLILAHKYKQPSNELKCYSDALHELFKAVTSHPHQFDNDRSFRCSNEDQSADSTALQDSQGLFTETDVTLASCLDGSPGSQETERDRELQLACHFPPSCGSSSSVVRTIYQEMMTIYEQLKAERQGQQQWERELHERERRLKQQEEAFSQLSGLKELIHSRNLVVEENHQREVSQLQDLLQERSKENKRLKSSFDSIRELNDNMKKQLNEISEQNKKLESQSKRVQARLENLQRKYEHFATPAGCQKGSVKSTKCTKPLKKEKTAAPGKPRNEVSSSPTKLNLLAVLLDWVLDGLTFSSVAGNKVKGVGHRLPPELVLNERCLKVVLPLLADQLHHTSLSEPDLLLDLLRLIYWTLRHIDNSTQHVALSATLRRIGEEVSRPSVPQREDPDLPKSCIETAGYFRSLPLYQSPCPHTRILSTLIILCTITQADVLAQVLDSLHAELMCEKSRGLFIHYEGVRALLSMVWSGCAVLHTPIDILTQLTEQSRYLNAFLETCSCKEFFRTASQLLKNPRLELPSLEKLSILLQKLSTIRKNRHLFELSSLHLQVKELLHKTNPTHTFLVLNLRSILHNLK